MRAVVTGSENADWLQDYCKANPDANGSWFLCSAVQLAESGKGYLLSVSRLDDYEGTEICKCFIWKNSGQGQLIRDILNESYELQATNPDTESFPVLLIQGTTTKQVPVGVEDIFTKGVGSNYFYSSRDLEAGQAARLKKNGTTPANTRRTRA